MSGDPAETALYLRRVYTLILENYFQGMSFFKPTGDGLLLVIPFEATEGELARVTREVVGDAVRLVDDFPTLVDGDKLIQFPHPKDIGVGLAAGSVSRIVADNLTLDYTGRPLNVASRLMDLARPCGVVAESTLDRSALDAEIALRFAEDHVYLKGVAEDEGVDVFYTSEQTRIPDRYRTRYGQLAWHRQKQEYTIGSFRRRSARWLERLDYLPYDRKQIDVRIEYHKIRGGRPDTSAISWNHPKYEYVLDRGEPYIALDMPKIAAGPSFRNLPARQTVSLQISYQYEPEHPHST